MSKEKIKNAALSSQSRPIESPSLSRLTGEPSSLTRGAGKHKVVYLFSKEKVQPYLFTAFLLFTKWEEKKEVTRDEFKKKLKEFLKR